MPSRTDITGAVFPLVIDQADITAPDFPRDAAWWRRFLPLWISVAVAPDGLVTLDYSGRRVDAVTPEWSAAQLPRGRGGMVRWVGHALGQYIRTEPGT